MKRQTVTTISLIASLATCGNGFVLPHSTCQLSKISHGRANPKQSFSSTNVLTKVGLNPDDQTDDGKLDQKWVERKQQVQNMLNSGKKLVQGVFDTGFGTRGEKGLAAEAFVLYCIAAGQVPLLKDLSEFLLGPVLLICGLFVMGMSMVEMSSAFTAYVRPVSKAKGGKLVTTGLFSYIRHPVYSGNMMCLIGWSILTRSSMRLLLSGLYFVLIEMKTRKEEDEMVKTFGNQYVQYRKQVGGKFIPTKDKLRKLLTRDGKRGGKIFDLLVEGTDGATDFKGNGTNGNDRINRRLFP